MVRGEVDCGDSWRLPSCSGLANVVAIVIHVAILFKLSMVFLMVFFCFYFYFFVLHCFVGCTDAAACVCPIWIGANTAYHTYP